MRPADSRKFAVAWSLTFWFLAAPAFSASTPSPTHHRLHVVFQVPKNQITVRDIVTLRPRERFSGTHSILWTLNKNLQLKLSPGRIFGEPLASRGFRLVLAGESPSNADDDPLQVFIVEKPPNQPWPEEMKITLDYSGPYFDALRSGSSYFYPQLHHPEEPERITFELTVDGPAQWKVVSQGRRTHETRMDIGRLTTWECLDPQEEIFLIADEFHEYHTVHGRTGIYAFLLTEEPALAKRYLEATRAYLDFYSRLLGEYPYPKFALVENRRQTGYGMPSFTLLGSRIIRFPFILRTSYPHEILHNWWGNGVYVDPDGGNWSEGLTSYLSDHLFPELDGKGDRYRFQELVKYLNYAAGGSGDFPLAQFKGRTDMATQAVGYGKWVLVLHMLRMELGDAVFLNSLRRFYKTWRFRFAGFGTLRKAFEETSGKILQPFFDQWVNRPGAPEIELAGASYTAAGDGFDLRIRIRQKKPVFHFLLPVAIWTRGKAWPLIRRMKIDAVTVEKSFHLDNEPARVLADPYYDVFRKLDRGEVPPSIGQTYGAETTAVIMDSGDAGSPLDRGYREFADALIADQNPPGEILLDTDSSSAMDAGGLWVLGRNNRLAEGAKKALEEFGIKLDESGVTVEQRKFPWKNHSFVFTVAGPRGPAQSLTWVVTNSPETLPGLIRKLPHYGKFGYMVFKGPKPTNQVRGTFPAQRGRLMKTFHPGKFDLPHQRPLVDYRPALPTRTGRR